MNVVYSEFPLRTYNELVQIFTIYNGSNDVEIVRNFPVKSRTSNSWIIDFKQEKMIKTNKTKSSPPHGYVLAKGYTNTMLHRKFVEYGVLDARARDLLDWFADTRVPDELQVFV